MSDLWNEETAREIADQVDLVAAASSNGHGRLPEIPPSLWSRYRLTDEGMANWLVDLYGESMAWVDGLEWMTWRDGCWHRDGKEMHVVRGLYMHAVWRRHLYLQQDGTDPGAITQFMRNYETDTRTKAIVRQAQRQRVVPHERVNGDRDLINCRNGVVNLRTTELLPHDPEYLMTKQTPGDYVPWVELPADDRIRFTEFLSWACQGDESLMRLICRAAGYSLTGETSEEALFLLWGMTRSGKSTFSESLANVMGSGYAGTLDAGVLLSSNRPRGNVDDKLARVAGCRLVNCAEPERGQRFTEGLIKMITSGDKIDAAFKFVTAFEFEPRWKVWFSTNHMPGSGDNAVRRRIRLIPFTHTVPQNREDASLKAWLKDPDRGGRVLLSWAVEGARGWYREGLRYEEVAVCQVWMEDYDENEDPVGTFLSQRVQRGVTDPDLWPQTKELYGIFERWFWAERQSLKVMSFQNFNDACKAHWLVPGRNRQGHRVWRDIQIIGVESDASVPL